MFKKEFFIALFLIFLTIAGAQKKEEQEATSKEDIYTTAVTQHKMKLGNKKLLSYTATTQLLKIEDESGKHKADIFFIAYSKDGVKDLSQRPITFAFNGGPGSSSVWLHLGALGPKMVIMDEKGNAFRPPYRWEDNASTWLEFTDLVFIDPVGTGFSRPAEEVDRKNFHGVEEDVKSVGDFIALYLNKYERWDSPKFLAGESYGTTRAAGLSDYLQSRHSMYLNGLILVSSILDFQTARFTEGNDLPYILFLPTYTATAWYHNKLAPELQSKELTKVLSEVETWALKDYAWALLQGSRLGEGDRKKIVERLALYTGLSSKYIEQTNLRINIHRFTKELLRDKKRTVGRLDSRFQGIDGNSVGEYTEHDPSYSNILGTYGGAINSYLRRELEFKTIRTYEILTGKVRPWNWGSASSGFPNTADDLRRAMSKNPYLKVFVANGYYDLATPYFATEHTVHHLGLEASLEKNISMNYYEAGHMMYIHSPSLVKLRDDVVKFMEGALPE